MSTQPNKKMGQVIEEMIQTEKTYKAGLEHLKNFLEEVQKNKNLLAKFGKSTIDGTLEMVRSMQNISESLLKELEKSRNNPIKVSEILKKYSEQMGKVYADYPANFSKINRVIGTLAQNKQYNQFERKFVENGGGGVRLLPGAYLIMPIQRLPRYELLAKEMYKHADLPEVEKAVGNALTQVREAASIGNEQRRWSEYLEKLNGKNQTERTEARTLKFMQPKGSSPLSDLKLASEQIKKLQHNGVFMFELVKGGIGRQTRVRAYLSGGEKEKYTFLVKPTPEGFALTIKQDISKLTSKEVLNLFEIAKAIGKTISPEGEALNPPYSLPKQQALQEEQALQEKSTTPTPLPPGAPKLVSQRQNEPMPPVKPAEPAAQAKPLEQAKPVEQAKQMAQTKPVEPIKPAGRPPLPSFIPSSIPVQRPSSLQQPPHTPGFPRSMTSAALMARMREPTQSGQVGSSAPTKQVQVLGPPLMLSEVEILKSLKEEGRGLLIKNDEQVREIGRMGKEEGGIRDLLSKYNKVRHDPTAGPEALKALQDAIKSKFEPAPAQDNERQLGSSPPKAR